MYISDMQKIDFNVKDILHFYSPFAFTSTIFLLIISLTDRGASLQPSVLNLLPAVSGHVSLLPNYVQMSGKRT